MPLFCLFHVNARPHDGLGQTICNALPEANRNVLVSILAAQCGQAHSVESRLPRLDFITALYLSMEVMRRSRGGRHRERFDVTRSDVDYAVDVLEGALYE